MKILVVQGQGLDKRGFSQIEVFGPEKLPEINSIIERDAERYGFSVEIVQSNDDSEVIGWLSELGDDVGAVVINPGGFTVSDSALPEKIAELNVPVFEVHASNPASRGVLSRIQPVCKGAVCGFGYRGYGMIFAELAKG